MADCLDGVGAPRDGASVPRPRRAPRVHFSRVTELLQPGPGTSMATRRCCRGSRHVRVRAAGSGDLAEDEADTDDPQRHGRCRIGLSRCALQNRRTGRTVRASDSWSRYVATLPVRMSRLRETDDVVASSTGLLGAGSVSSDRVSPPVAVAAASVVVWSCRPDGNPPPRSVRFSRSVPRWWPMPMAHVDG